MDIAIQQDHAAALAVGRGQCKNSWHGALNKPRVPPLTYSVMYAGAGLQVLRSNNLIHRDLKPQVMRDVDTLKRKRLYL